MKFIKLTSARLRRDNGPLSQPRNGSVNTYGMLGRPMDRQAVMPERADKTVITMRFGSRSVRYHYARFADGSTAVISLDGADMSKR